MPLPKDWRAFIESLNLNGVEYLIVGALALAHHGLPRYTGDLDLLIHNTGENARLLVSAIQGFGLGGLGLKPEDFTGPFQVVQLGVPPRRIDLLTSITGVSFDNAWAGRVTAELDGVQVNIIGRLELIQNKKATRRPRDLADLTALGEGTESI